MSGTGPDLSGYGGDDVFDIGVNFGRGSSEPYGLPSCGTVDGGPGRDVAVLHRCYSEVDDTITPANIALRYDMPGAPGVTGSMVLGSVETLRFLDGSLYIASDTAGGRADALFRTVLGRAPDAATLGYWADAVQGSGEIAVAQGLLATAEGQTRFGSLDDAGFVSALYREALGREADAGGVSYWTGRLAVGASRAAVAAGIADGDEARAKLAPTFAAGVFAIDPLAVGVLRLELAGYGRLLAPDAIARQIDALRDGSRTLRDIESTIAQSASYSYDAGSTPTPLSNAEFVDRVIRNVFGAPDSGAAAYYTAQLDSGAGTRADVLRAYASSPGIDARVAPYITDHGLLLG